ncbi:MAG: hypothetical protein IJW77_04825 [Clostridia bacterium]|nr:hypothetical protein [Clostridia bacterium]
MKHTTKLFSLTAALMLLLCACSGGDTTTTSESTSQTTEAPSGTEPTPKYTLSDQDWDGAEFIMMVGEGYVDSFVTMETGDALDDARYRMVRTVEEGLNVEISDVPVDFWEMNNIVTQYVMSGENTYDAIAMMDRFALTAAMANNFIPIQDVDTIHTEAEYWGGSLASEMTVAGNQYFAISSSDLNTFDHTSCILWNTKLGTSLGLSVPWEDVFAGTWTWSDLQSYASAANRDLNGDGVWTDADRYTYGFADIRGAVSTFVQAFDMRFVQKDADDIPYITVTDNEPLMDVLTGVHELFFTGPNDVMQMCTKDNEIHNRPVFQSGNMLMMISLFCDIQSAREMEDDFAVLPMPKYDEQQASYRSRTYDAIFYSVPVTQDDVTFSGAVMDALSCVAYYDLVPVYIDTVLKDKASRDENSKRAIQICFDTRTMDFGESFLSEYFGDGPLTDLIKSKNFTPASHFEKSAKSMDKRLEKIIEGFVNIEG